MENLLDFICAVKDIDYGYANDLVHPVYTFAGWLCSLARPDLVDLLDEEQFINLFEFWQFCEETDSRPSLRVENYFGHNDHLVILTAAIEDFFSENHLNQKVELHYIE